MSSSNSTERVHHDFKKWACETQGVVLTGIDATRFPGRGYGVEAVRDIVKGERLIFVPVRSLITITSSFVKALKLPKDCTVHGKLAAALTMLHRDEDKWYQAWEKTWPSQEDMRSLPLMWDNSVTTLLPEPAKGT